MVAPHIMLDERGRPWLEGTNTKVIEVVLDYLAHGWSPEEMHRHHPHLPLVKLYAAMAYYLDHKPELDAEVERQLREADAARAAAGESPLARRLRLSGKIA
jgi:uncharacterized protein (DUF433 family)